MEAAKRIKKAIEQDLGLPLTYSIYPIYPAPTRPPNKKPAHRPETYCTYQHVISTPTAYADDDNTAVESIWRVDLFTAKDYTDLLPRIVAALKGEEFYGVTIEIILYEQERGLYHVPFEMKYLEE